MGQWSRSDLRSWCHELENGLMCLKFLHVQLVVHYPRTCGPCEFGGILVYNSEIFGRIHVGNNYRCSEFNLDNLILLMNLSLRNP